MPDCVPLHVHSHYSLLDGLAKIDDLVAKAKESGFSSMALTDHGVMYGIVEFYQKAKAAGVKPIIGCEMYLAPRKMTDKTPKIDTSPYHLILLIKDKIGYGNLIKLVTEAHLKGYYYKPRIDKDLLKKHSAGLIALTSCLQGEIPRLILSNKLDKAKEIAEEYQQIFGKGNFFLEIQYHPEIPEQNKVNLGLKKIADELKIGLVATNDSHYLNQEDSETHEVLLAVQTGKNLEDDRRLSMRNSDFSFWDKKTFIENFRDYPDALANSLKIAEKCNLELDLGKFILPRFELPKGENSNNYLKELCEKGFLERYSATDKVAKKRLAYELSVIDKTNFSDYFLIVQDFINWAKNQGIVVGPGRGSAAGSIVSYCLNITELDPLRYNLLFERFLNPERIAPPDIDMDFADDRREEVIHYVREKYGADHVAQIITFGVMKARMAIRDAGRALGRTYQDVDRLAKLIPLGFTIAQTLEEVDEFKKLYQSDPEVKKLIDITKKLEGVARHASTHAAGVVISQKSLTEYVPLQFATRGDEEIVTQYSMYDVEKIGLLKMDFLGLSNLTVIKNAIRIIRKIKEVNIDLTKIPLDDKKTYALVARGQTTGVFQLESEGMKRYLKELKPSVIDDIIAMVALYRPGPMEFIPDYIAGKHNKKKISYLDPRLEPILADTYGIAVYQEQVMKIAQDVAGFTLGEADVLRKAVGKKIHKLLMEQKKKFISRAIENKVSKSIAEKIFSFIEPFARYGFNRAHAASYGLIAYQTAYLKANYTSEFMAALLTSDFQNLDRVAIEIAECERLGIKVFPPNINQSFVEFGVIKESGHITFGLAAIKNVGLGVAEAIVKEREDNGPYKNLEDFLNRSGSEVINKKSLENLAKAGALDDFAERNQLLAGLEQILKFSTARAKQKAQGQVSLFEKTSIKEEISRIKLPKTTPADKKIKLAWEKELLGIYLTDHPLKGLEKTLAKYAEKISEISSTRSGAKIKVGGIITSVKKIITKSSEPMLFVRLEDTTANTEIIVFPRTLKENYLIWQPDNIVIVEGKVNTKDGMVKIIAERAKEIGEQLTLDNQPEKADQEKKLVIKIDKFTDKESLNKIKMVLADYPGKQDVLLNIEEQTGEKIIPTKSKVNISEKLKSALTEILGAGKIEIR